jgi:phage-related protein
MRPVIFHPLAREAIRSFPGETRSQIGRRLYQLQMGEQLGMPHARQMPGVAPGVSELRIRDHAGAWRVFYFVLSRRGIFVIHAFAKKTRKTPLDEIKLAQKRLKELLDA